jgi:hypothetical protein
LEMADVVEAVVVSVTACFSGAAAVMLLGIASGEEAALGAAEEGEASVLASANSLSATAADPTVSSVG